MPCDPCQEMEPQGAEHRRGLWLEEVGELASLLSCSRWPGGLLASSKAWADWRESVFPWQELGPAEFSLRAMFPP